MERATAEHSRTLFVAGRSAKVLNHAREYLPRSHHSLARRYTTSVSYPIASERIELYPSAHPVLNARNPGAKV